MSDPGSSRHRMYEQARAIDAHTVANATPTPREDIEAAYNKAAFKDAVTFLYNSQHTDLGFPKEKAIRAAAHAEALRRALDAARTENAEYQRQVENMTGCMGSNADLAAENERLRSAPPEGRGTCASCGDHLEWLTTTEATEVDQQRIHDLEAENERLRAVVEAAGRAVESRCMNCGGCDDDDIPLEGDCVYAELRDHLAALNEGSSE